VGYVRVPVLDQILVLVLEAIAMGERYTASYSSASALISAPVAVLVVRERLARTTTHMLRARRHLLFVR